MKRLILIILALLTVSICNAGPYSITPQIDFGTVTPGTELQPEVIIKNTGTEILQIGGIGITNPLAKPFRIVDTGCANSIIQPGSECAFMVLFSPDAHGGPYTDSFEVEIANLGIKHEVQLTGNGGPVVDEPDIQLSFSSVNFGTIDVLERTDPAYIFPPPGSPIPVILIKNIGTGLNLDISSVKVTGQDSSEVTVLGDCVGSIPPGNSCGIAIEFKPLNPGKKDVAVSIESNDPDESVFDFRIRAIVTGEDDGVQAEIEDAGPNNGDGNNDTILDSKQSYVTTLPDLSGNYVTFLTSQGYRFRNMSVLPQADVDNVPADLRVATGVFDFTLEGVAPGQAVELGIILPAGTTPESFYGYGATPDNPDQHWFDFTFDGETGALILGDAVFTSQSGEKFTRSVVRVILQDGKRGDSDMNIDGLIRVTAGFAGKTGSDDGAASFSLFQLMLIAFVLISVRRYKAGRRLVGLIW